MRLLRRCRACQREQQVQRRPPRDSRRGRTTTHRGGRFLWTGASRVPWNRFQIPPTRMRRLALRSAYARHDRLHETVFCSRTSPRGRLFPGARIVGRVSHLEESSFAHLVRHADLPRRLSAIINSFARGMLSSRAIWKWRTAPDTRRFLNFPRKIGADGLSAEVSALKFRTGHARIPRRGTDCRFN